MSTQFIPVGRTSLVHRAEAPLQVQTEYAARPLPRITTTILTNGQVLHKIERPLEHPVIDLEMQHQVEGLMHKQHLAVLETLQGKPSSAEASSAADDPVQITDLHQPVPFSEAIADLPGVQRIYVLDQHGNFIGGGKSTEQFKKLFSAVIKDLKALLDLFGPVPSLPGSRERGVYEVERNRLYFASDGGNFYFILVYPLDDELNYEFALRAALVQTVA